MVVRSAHRELISTIKKIIISLVLLLSFTGVALAQQDEDKDIRYPTLQPEARGEKPTYEIKKGKFSFTVSLLEGYDNNVRLNSARLDDTFSEQDLYLSYEHPLADKLTFFITNAFSNITYCRFSDASLLSNDLRAGLDVDFSETSRLRIDYDFEALRYYQMGDSDYLSHIPRIEFKHYSAKNFYQLIGYKYMDRGFLKGKIRDSAGQLLREKRRDKRHTGIFEIGYFLPKSLLRLKNEYYANDSNDQFLNFYDYWADLLSLSIVHLFSKRLSGFLSVGHEWRKYDDRAMITEHPFTTQADKMLIGYASASYDITKAISLNVEYAYREKKSNDSNYKYSGSIMSAALNFTF